MKRIFTLTLTMFMFCLSGALTASAAEKANANGGTIHWLKLAEGEKIAAEQKKPMVVDFATGAGCPRCEEMGKDAYKDPEVISRLNRDFVPVKVDLSRPLSDEERDLGNRFNYRNDCLLLFLDYKEKPIADPIEGRLCFVDAVSKNNFLKYLDLTLKNAEKAK